MRPPPSPLLRLTLRPLRTQCLTRRTLTTKPAATEPATSSPDPFTPIPPSLPLLTQKIRSTLFDASTPPSEDRILSALRALRAFAPTHPPPTPPADEAAATKTLLNPGVRRTNLPPDAAEITDLTYTILSHPQVFLTPQVLKTTLTITARTRDASIIPATLHLYANKPAPGAKKAYPKSAKNAVPERIAQEALEQTLAHGDMTAALDCVDLSFAAPAWRRRKIMTQVLPAVGVVCAAPVAIWGVASRMVEMQDVVDPKLAVKYAFTGLCAYAGFTVSIGLVALATSNDQMVRVTWMKGTPLRERWMRERERAALDEVAGWYGFGDEGRRGDEEGAEWELLREVVGRKGMVLDETSLMKGME